MIVRLGGLTTPVGRPSRLRRRGVPGAGDGNRTRVASLEALYAPELLCESVLVGGRKCAEKTA